jgi:hypothetical protein
MHSFRLRLLATCLLLAAGAAHASTADSSATGELVRIELKDGNSLVGTVARESADSLLIRLPSGAEITLAKSLIASRTRIDAQVREGTLVRLDPNRSRLLFAPTARPVRHGTGYLAFYEIFFPYLAVGIGDVLTLAGGISLVPGATDQIFYVGPKVSVALGSGGSYLAIGGHYANTFSSSSEGVAVLYGLGTFGSHTTALTVGAGYGYAESQFSENPLLILGGEAQLSGSIKLITENWIPVGGEAAILSLGVRFFGDRLSADFGFYYLTEVSTEGFPFLPWLSFAYLFGS